MQPAVPIPASSPAGSCPSPPLLLLPPEVLARIADLCKGLTFLNLRATCKGLHGALQPRGIRVLEHDIHSGRQDLQLAARLAAAWPAATRANIQHTANGLVLNAASQPWLVPPTFLMATTAAALWPHWSQLQDVRTHWSLPVVAALVGVCPGLQRLTLSDDGEQWHCLMSADRHVRMPVSMAAIRSHHVMPSLGCLAGCSSLRSLTACLTQVALDGQGFQQLGRLTQLESLQLDLGFVLANTSHYEEVVAALPAALAPLTRLTRLVLEAGHSFGRFLSPDGLFRFKLPPLPRLRELHACSSANQGPGHMDLDPAGLLPACAGCLTRLVWSSSAHSDAERTPRLPALAQLRQLTSLVQLDCLWDLALDEAGCAALALLPHLALLRVNALRVGSAPRAAAVLPALRALHVLHNVSCAPPLSALMPALAHLRLHLEQDWEPATLDLGCLRDHPGLTHLALAYDHLTDYLPDLQFIRGGAMEQSVVESAVRADFLAPLASLTRVTHLTLELEDLSSLGPEGSTDCQADLPLAALPIRRLTLTGTLRAAHPSGLPALLAALPGLELVQLQGAAGDDDAAAVVYAAVCMAAALPNLRALELHDRMLPVLCSTYKPHERPLPRPPRMAAAGSAAAPPPPTPELRGLGCLTAVLVALAASPGLCVLRLVGVGALRVLGAQVEEFEWEQQSEPWSLDVANNVLAGLQHQVDVATHMAPPRFEVQWL